MIVEILNTGNNSAIAIVPIIVPMIMIMIGSIREVAFLIVPSSFFS